MFDKLGTLIWRQKMEKDALRVETFERLDKDQLQQEYKIPDPETDEERAAKRKQDEDEQNEDLLKRQRIMAVDQSGLQNIVDDEMVEILLKWT